MAETNGTTEAAVKVSAVAKLVNGWRDKGSKLPDGKVQKDLIGKFKTLNKARNDAQKVLDKANAELSAHAELMVQSFGDKKLELDGTLYFPASRGDTVFYRSQGEQDPDNVIKG